MKKSLSLLLFCILATYPAAARKAAPQGTIKYDMTILLRKQAGREHAMIAQFLPEEQHMQITLAYKGNTYAVTRQQPPVTNKNDVAGRSLSMAMNMGGGRQLVNTGTGLVRTEYVFKNRNFYTEELPGRQTGIRYLPDTKTILGYTCHKATITRDGKVTTVWYTEEFPGSYVPEPGVLSAIRGTVLEYITEFVLYRATAITPAFKPADLAQRTPARKITEEQAEDMMEESMESMKDELEENAGNGARKVKTTTTVIKL